MAGMISVRPEGIGTARSTVRRARPTPSRVLRAAAFVGVAGGLVVGGFAAPARADSSSGAAAAAMTCSTAKVNSKTARGWCSGGSLWRVGVRCTDGKHYYSAWERDRRNQYATCGSGRITHYWIDN